MISRSAGDRSVTRVVIGSSGAPNIRQSRPDWLGWVRIVRHQSVHCLLRGQWSEIGNFGKVLLRCWCPYRQHMGEGIKQDTHQPSYYVLRTLCVYSSVCHARYEQWTCRWITGLSQVASHPLHKPACWEPDCLVTVLASWNKQHHYARSFVCVVSAQSRSQQRAELPRAFLSISVTKQGSWANTSENLGETVAANYHL
ncbi:hypothetical protein VTK73DRAFT_10380 [Phialemonium thermophilum]|uniref:Uncharacterized protein n=1 Tax=Phialemonium thermophilum TaxID=223376 RepID=A0ABR3VWX6_9PEZI